jgi:hypothetical protein
VNVLLETSETEAAIAMWS